MANGFKQGYLKRVSELDRTAHLKNAATAAAFLGTELVSIAKRQDEFVTTLEVIQERLAKSEKALEESATAIGELQVENEKLAADNKLLREQLAGRFAPIHESLARLDPTYKPPAKPKPKEGA